MKEDFLIIINSTQTVGSKKDSISLKALGSYEVFPDKKQISFYEYDPEDSNKKYLSTLLIEKNNKIIFTKKGLTNSQLILQKDQRHMCHYLTEFGTLQVGTFTNKVDIDLNKNGGKIFARYSIDINSSITSYNTIHIEVRKVEEKNV